MIFNKHSTKITSIIVLFVLVLISGGIYSYMLVEPDENKQVDTKELKGQICKVNNTSFMLRTLDKNEQEYTFSKDKDLTLLNGNIATIHYVGSLDDKLKVQDVIVNDISIEETLISNLEDQHVDQKISDILQSMTLEEKIGQMIIGRVPQSNQIETIQTYHLGGYILFGRDFEEQSINSMKERVKSYQDVAKIPLLIATSEEGGTVAHASNYLRYRPFSSVKQLYQSSGMDTVVADSQDKINFLKELGINVNIAPVCDIVSDPNAFLYLRAFGDNPKRTSDYVRNSVIIYNDNHFGCVMKHFPGYGDSINETDVNTKELKTFQKNDFLPFEAGIKANGNCILVSNQVVECIDENKPASLSKQTSTLLRDEFDYYGVIMDDDLSMLQSYGSDDELIIAAVQAGNDLLFSTNMKVQVPALIKAVENGKISKNQIDQSVLRILKWKESIGLL